MTPLISPLLGCRALAPRLLAAMLLVLGMRLSLSAQSAVAPLAAGKSIQFRITDYDFSTSRTGNPLSIQRDWRVGAELLFEKVKEDGRGTRFMIGWAMQDEWNRSVDASGNQTYGYAYQHFIRVGWGKSQTYLLKRLMMRGGVDNFFQVGTGLHSGYSSLDGSSNSLSYADAREVPSFQFGIRPFLGLGFQASSHFAVGIESGLLLSLTAELGNFRESESNPRWGAVENESGQYGLVLDAGPSAVYPFLVLTYQF
jgi:hypothetical protein